MTKYHINGKGVPSICRAEKGNCPFGGQDSHYDSEAEAQKAANKMNSMESGGILPMTKHFGASEKVDLTKKMATQGVASIDGYFLGSPELKAVESQRRYFEEDGGPQEIVDMLNEGEDEFEVRQNLTYYFPISDDDGNIDRKKEKNVRLATANIVKMHEIGKETDDEYKVKEKLEDFNVDYTSKEVFANVDVSGRKPNKDAVSQAKRLFESYANNDKFYRYMHDEGAAKNLVEKNEGVTLDNSKTALKAQKAAFELAKGYYENKILYNTLEDNRDRIINKLSSQLEKAFSK